MAAKEAKLENVMIALEKENPLESFTDSVDLMQSFLYYAQAENARYIVNKIKEVDGEKRKDYIRGIVVMYPISEKILTGVVEEYPVSEMKKNMIEWFDTSEVIYKLLNKFLSLFGEAESFSNSATDLEGQIERLEVKKQNIINSKKELEKKVQECEGKKREVEKLQEQEKELKKQLEQYNDTQIRKREKELKDLQKEINTAKNRVEGISEELKKYKNGAGSQNFDKAMKKLEEVIKTLPKDEVDN